MKTKNQIVTIETKQSILAHCECGRTMHQEDAIYCGSCGKKLEKIATTTFSKK